MTRYEILQKNAGWFIFFVLVVISAGGLAEIVPLFFIRAASGVGSPVATVAGLRPYDALRLEGRDIYLREGCSGCHTQMIRSLYRDAERYGRPSVAGESAYDHPFLWGSRRTGPDLARVGGHYSIFWHQEHLRDPRSVVPWSVMPPYPWLEKTVLDGFQTVGKMRRMNILFSLTCPTCAHYSEKEIQEGPGKVRGKTESDALIAYLYGDAEQPGGLGGGTHHE